MLNVEQEIARVEHLYRQITGSEPKRSDRSVAPIPPDANAEQVVEENLRRLASALQASTQLAEIPAVLPRIALFESDAEWRCAVELPGVRRNDLTVQVTQGVLRLAAVRPLPGADDGALRPTYAEALPCRFERSIPLPGLARFDALDARLDNGILVIRCPKDPAAVRRDVKIDVA